MSGYFTEFSYKANLHPEIELCQLDIALSQQGNRIPKNARVCEVGFGMGLNLLQNVIGSTHQVFGVDLISEHVRFVTEGMEVAGMSLKDQIVLGSITDQVIFDTWPKMDVIILHGVWSWIDDLTRSELMSFLREKLAPGGIVYISYNISSGWGLVPALRPLLKDAYERASKFIQPAKRVESAYDFWLEHIVQPIDVRSYETLKKNRVLGAGYLAHEFLNEAWYPTSLNEICKQLSVHDITFHSSARLAQQHPSLTNSAAITEKLGQLGPDVDDVYRLSVDDALHGVTFRADIFHRGLWLGSHREFPEDITVIRTAHARGVKPVRTGDTKRQISDEVVTYFNALPIEGIAVDQLERDLKARFGYGPNDVLVFLQVLRGYFEFMSASKPTQSELESRAVALNEWIRKNHADLKYWFSPVLGGFVHLTDFEKTVYRFRKLPKDAQIGQLIELTEHLSIYEDGRELLTAEEKKAHLVKKLDQFHEERIAILQLLGLW